MVAARRRPDRDRRGRHAVSAQWPEGPCRVLGVRRPRQVAKGQEKLSERSGYAKIRTHVRLMGEPDRSKGLGWAETTRRCDGRTWSGRCPGGEQVPAVLSILGTAGTAR